MNLRILFKIILKLVMFISVVCISLIGSITVGSAVMGFITFSSLISGVVDPLALFLFNLGAVIITVYVFFRLYRFFEYIINKFYLIMRNVVVSIGMEIKDSENKK